MQTNKPDNEKTVRQVLIEKILENYSDSENLASVLKIDVYDLIESEATKKLESMSFYELVDLL